MGKGKSQQLSLLTVDCESSRLQLPELRLMPMHPCSFRTYEISWLSSGTNAWIGVKEVRIKNCYTALSSHPELRNYPLTGSICEVILLNACRESKYSVVGRILKGHEDWVVTLVDDGWQESKSVRDWFPDRLRDCYPLPLFSSSQPSSSSPSSPFVGKM